MSLLSLNAVLGEDCVSMKNCWHGLLLRCAIVTATLVMCACRGELSERARVTSPDGKLQAIVAERSSGATVATPVELYVVPSNGTLSGEPLLVGDRFANLRPVWKGPNFLEVQYDKGRVFKFTNFWQPSNPEQFQFVVEIRLKPSTDSFALP